MARTTGSDGARTEEAIRQAAIELIAARGFEAMTLRELAEKVGLQAGSIYRYFPSKAQLLVALLLEHLNFLLEQWRLERPADAGPTGQLRAFIDFHIRSHTLRRRDECGATGGSPGLLAVEPAVRRHARDEGRGELLFGNVRESRLRRVARSLGAAQDSAFDCVARRHAAGR